MSMGSTPALCEASTMNKRSCSCANAPEVTAESSVLPVRFREACVQTTARVSETQQPFKIGVVDVPLPVCGNKAQLDIVFPFQPVKRSQDRVVLKVGRIACFARVEMRAMDGDVQRLGRVTGERRVVRPLAVKERGELAARVVDHARGGKRLLVRAACAVAKAPHRRDHRVDDLRRLSQRRRRVIKIESSYGRTTRSAPLIVSTMTYMFVASPTASFSLRS